MKIKELVALLEEHDPEAELVIASDYKFDHEILSVYETHDGVCIDITS